MSKVTTGKKFNIPNPNVTYWRNEEADNIKEAKKLGYRSSYSTTGYRDFPLKEILIYMKEHWFEFMYKPDIRDMMQERPGYIGSENIIDKFIEKFEETVKDLEQMKGFKPYPRSTPPVESETDEKD